MRRSAYLFQKEIFSRKGQLKGGGEVNEEDRGELMTPIIFREIGGTVYGVYGYFSPEARETAEEKIRRLLREKSGQKSIENGG